MNAKYYPALRKVSEYATKVVAVNPSIADNAKKPSDIVVKVYDAMNGTIGKDTALEVAKVIFYGYYKEVNAYYSSRS